MSMLSIDTYAYTNRLKKTHPIEKTLFALIPLLTCLTFEEISLYLFVIVSMTSLTVVAAGIPAKFYLKVLTLPLPFVFMGVLTVIVNFSVDPSVFDFYINLFSVSFGVTWKSIQAGMVIFFRTYSCVSCLYFLSLTTPMVDITWVMRKMKVPAIFIEILSIIYRFIFELLDTAFLIKISQESRLGYVGIKRSWRSLGLLISNVFVKCFQHYKELTVAMESRLYNGEFKVLEEQYRYSKRNIIFMGVYFVALGCLIVLNRLGN